MNENFGINSGVYGTLFYTMTGFHGAHVLGGVIGLSVILSRGMQGQFSAKHHVAVEAVSAYWHFVDIVWVCPLRHDLPAALGGGDLELAPGDRVRRDLPSSSVPCTS